MSGLRLASHIHTSWSDDSDWELPRLRRWLRAAGYDGALVCDHDRTMTQGRLDDLVAACRSASDERFMFVPGVEYQDPDHVVHVPVWGETTFFGRSPDIDELLDHAVAHGRAAVLAHPARRDAWRRFRPAWADRLRGIEVWSRKYDGLAPNGWAASTARRHGLAPYVALDYHGPRQLFPLAMHVDTPLDEGRVTAALAHGETTPRAIGIDPGAFEQGLLGRAASGAESGRSWLAPKIRRLEAAARGRRAG